MSNRARKFCIYFCVTLQDLQDFRVVCFSKCSTSFMISCLVYGVFKSVKNNCNLNHLKAYTIIFHNWNVKECVFLRNYQDGIVENYWKMCFLNTTNVLTNGVNCTGTTFILTLFWRVMRDFDKVPWIISFKFMYGAAFSIIFIIIISDK